jgi:hypothetical protein
MTIYGFSDILTSPIGDRLSALAVKTLWVHSSNSPDFPGSPVK